MQTTEPVLASAIETTPTHLVLVLGDQHVRIPWVECSEVLAAASDADRANAELSPAGYGIHWPGLDEDLSVSGLLRK